MTFRTPRRRISPRTRRKYTAFRNFFKRAIGNSQSCQPDIKIHSSVHNCVNASDFKQRESNTRKDYKEISQNHRNCMYIEKTTEETSEGSSANYVKGDRREKRSPMYGDDTCVNVNKNDTRILYQPEGELLPSDEQSHIMLKCGGHKHRRSKPTLTKISSDNHEEKGDHKSSNNKKLKIRSGLDMKPDYTKLRKHKSQHVANSNLTSTSYHSLSIITPTYFDDNHKYRHPQRITHKQHQYKFDTTYEPVINRYNAKEPLICHEDKINYKAKPKLRNNELDDDFIAKLIKKQYKPIKVYDKKYSGMSQFSAPICRDQEHQLRQIREELCSSDYDRDHPKLCKHGITDMRSICDTRLYSNKKVNRHKHRKKYTDIYNDATLYDVIPVKEKSSPKTRRKFEEEHFSKYHTYKDILPSPRSQRPKLNLQAQYRPESDDYLYHPKVVRKCINQYKSHNDYSESNESEQQCYRNNFRYVDGKTKRKKKDSSKHLIFPEDIYMANCSAHATELDNRPSKNQNNTNVCTENKRGTEKADKALNEIKDILQTFLQEIKKEATSSNSDNKSEVMTTPKTNNNEQVQTNFSGTSNLHQNHEHSDFISGIGKCDVPPCPQFNPCCYPILPMYPMNCMQNAYCMQNVIPSHSLTCPMCARTSKDASHANSEQNQKSGRSESVLKVSKNSLTEELIKEIYKCVTTKSKQGSKFRNQSPTPSPRSENQYKQFTPRSARQHHISKHDAQVGTPRLKCHSKSCEAFGSKIVSETHVARTQGTLSDTILEKRSVDPSFTHTPSRSNLSTSDSLTTIVTKKKNKFAKVLKSLGLLKKKKERTNIELTESEKSIPKKKNPYKQEILNFLIHGHEYYNQPPIPHMHSPHKNVHHHHHHPGHQGIDPRQHGLQQMPMGDYFSPPYFNNYPPEMYGDGRYPPQDHRHYNHSHAPLCLKEVEVKSIATQSDDKNKTKSSFFGNFKKKIQNANYDDYRKQTNATQTKNITKAPEKLKPFSWNKNAKTNRETDPLKFSYNTQKMLAQGNINMRNEVLKKLFYKRNPFSPRNLIVRTILGKDKSSYGEPVGALRPKMFF